MKARVFPKLDIPEDLNNLDRFIGHYETVKEQIEFLKYVKLEMELYYEQRFEIEIDAMEVKEYNDWNKIIDKKIKFYESLLTDDIDKKFITTRTELESNKTNIDTERFDTSDYSKQINKFSGWWNNIVNTNFNAEMIIMALDSVGYENENEFIKYMKSMYGRRTQLEWMKYFEIQDKLEQYQKLKAQKLTPEIEYQNSIKITNAKYEESTVGQATLQSLRSFEEKFVQKSESERIDKETKPNPDLMHKWELKKAFEKAFDGLTIADTLEEKIYKDIEYWEGFAKVKQRETNSFAGESWELAVAILKTYILDDLKQAKVTGYYKGKKIDIEAADRLHKFLIKVIDTIESNNQKNDDDEFDEDNIEEFRIISKGKNIDVIVDESEPPAEINEKQREKIKKFLVENYSDFDTNYSLNVNSIAFEITDFYYPTLTKPERKKKKEVIRQELLLFRKR